MSARKAREGESHPPRGWGSGPLAQLRGDSYKMVRRCVSDHFGGRQSKSIFVLFKQLSTFRNQEHSQSFPKAWEPQMAAGGQGGAVAALLSATPRWGRCHNSRSRF